RASVFGRSGAKWSPPTELVGPGAQDALPICSVALSGDGGTVVVGGNNDDGGDTGAAWVFTRSGGTWTQQQKLVGTGAIGSAYQGTSVALSGDGNTAIVGGPCDNGTCASAGAAVGAAWVFTRSGGTGAQHRKRVGTGALGSANQVASVALSGGGNTAIVGGDADNSGNPGAAWVFTRSGSTWSQQQKLVGTGAAGSADQGWSAALSCNNAVVGALEDNTGTGAAWVFIAPPTQTHEFNGDCNADHLCGNRRTREVVA